MDGTRPPAGATLGLFSSSLVKQQTNRHPPTKRELVEDGNHDPDGRLARIARYEATRLPSATAIESRFRHGGWWADRERMIVALRAAAVRPGRLERFMACGGDCVAEWSRSRNCHRLRANYCGDRFCVPCATARGVKVRRRIEQLIGKAAPLAMEFTLRATDRPLIEQLNDLLAAFVRLRHSRLWKGAVSAGCAVIEIKKGKGSGLWHPHLHVIAIGGYMPQKELSRAWSKASGGSPVVWIKRVENPEKVIGYITKYATKGWTAEVAHDPAALLESVIALRGRRLVSVFGKWVGAGLDQEDLGAADWVVIGRLDRIWAAAHDGEAWASGVILSLARGVEEHARGIMERVGMASGRSP